MRPWIRRLVPLSILVLSIGALSAVPSLTTQAAPVRGWTAKFGSLQHDAITAVALDGVGGVVVAGWTDGSLRNQSAAIAVRQAFVRTFDVTGAELWTSEFGATGGSVATQVVAKDGNVFVAGQAAGALTEKKSTGSLAFVRKYDTLGREEWTQQFGYGDQTGVSGLSADANGDVYVAGWVDGRLAGQTEAGQYDGFVVKFSSAGRTVWVRQFGTRAQDRAISLTPDAAGVTVGYLTGDSDDQLTAQVRHYAADGNAGPSVTLPLSAGEAVFRLSADAAGNVYMAGSEQHENGHGFVRKYDLNGKEVWTRSVKKLDATSTDAVDVVVDATGGVFVAGRTRADRSKVDVALVRSFSADGVDLNGVTGLIDQPLGGRGAVTSLAAAGGQVVIAGWTNGALTSRQRSAGRGEAFVRQLSP